MKLRNAASRIRRKNEEWDRKFVQFVERHMDLFLAVAALGLVVWAIVTPHIWYVPAIVAVGAVSFFAGFIESLVVAALITGMSVGDSLTSGRGIEVSSTMMQVFGDGCVAWLGYRHHEQQRVQKERAEKSRHADSVIPWAVTNEVRTTLAAIRFLLFPLHEDEPQESAGQPIRIAADELQRLENLFSDIERSQQPPQATVPERQTSDFGGSTGKT